MSFHGGVIGTSLGILYLARREGLQWLRLHDYVACTVPFGLFFGRLANFVNAELWGAPTNVPWGVRFPEVVDGLRVLGPARHPSQLYEAAARGPRPVRSSSRSCSGAARRATSRASSSAPSSSSTASSASAIEFVREPDAQLTEFAAATGLHMGQWLTIPMIVGGLYLMATAKKRRVRVDPILGSESVA